MKKLSLILSIALVLASCDIDKVYINGDLDGMWQLQQIESADTLIKPQGVYYSFQRHMAQVSKHYEEEIPLRFIANLDYSGKEISIYGMRRFLEEEKLPTKEELKILYLPSDSITFKILTIGKENLIISCKDCTYSLRRW